VLVAAGAAVYHVYGQSPSATASATLNGRAIEIRYSAPSVRGRQIFGPGKLLSTDPTYPVWRAGANAATTLTTTGDVTIGDLVVPAGKYTLYVNVQDPNAWELIVNRETGQWGRSYDASEDLGRVKMAMSTPPALVERLRYSIDDDGGGKGTLSLAWERRVGSVTLTAKEPPRWDLRSGSWDLFGIRDLGLGICRRPPGLPGPTRSDRAPRSTTAARSRGRWA
jgi:hypothetical protein